MSLIPTIIKTDIPVINKETGLTESKEISRTVYYQGKYPQGCKACFAKKDKDLTYTIKLRRNGSAYCEDCSNEYKHGKENIILS